MFHHRYEIVVVKPTPGNVSDSAPVSSLMLAPLAGSVNAVSIAGHALPRSRVLLTALAPWRRTRDPFPRQTRLTAGHIGTLARTIDAAQNLVSQGNEEIQKLMLDPMLYTIS